MDPASPFRILGRYALYAEMASGGMATIHYGRLMGPVGFSRTVAIKRLHPQFAKEPDFVSMFLDEARLAARIRHPNVVPTLDVVATEGELFLVMDYVQGESVGRLIRLSNESQRRIPPPIAVAIAVGALHGLHAAHEATSERGDALSLVHRDVSPQNILVGIDGVPRVLDFGIAKAAGALHTSRDGQLKGKLAYMAPEQLRGKVSRATDIFALGVVLWEMLVGRRLFSADGEAELFGIVLEAKAERPSRYAPGIPAELEAHLLRALDPDPAKRFATAREMARAIEKSVPLVSASDVGEWVADVAEKALAERAQRIAGIENSSADHVATTLRVTPSYPSVPYLQAQVEPSRSPTSAGAAPVSDQVSTQLSSASITGTDRASSQNVRLSLLVGLAGVGLSVVVLLAVLIGLRLRRPPAAVASPLEPETALPSAPPAPAAPASAAPEIVDEALNAAGSAPTPASSTSARPHGSPTVRHPPSTPAAKGKPLGTVLDTRK
jgi:serine/threonine-protein kinase